MSLNRRIFLQHLGQTTREPLLLETQRAEGVYIYDIKHKKYLDFTSGFSVSNIGHSHPQVVQAVQQQAAQYMHLTVYGEFIQTPQIQLAKRLTSLLPPALNCTYLVNSGTEAIEGAMKLAKRYTQRSEIIAFRNAYHGSTQGAMSIMGSEEIKYAYRPLLPDIKFLDFNNFPQLHDITERTACVVVEPVQAEAGVVVPSEGYLNALRQRCSDTDTLLIFDEIQTGMGRTGSMFAFEKYFTLPDILVLGKALGGGMPLGAFISSHEIMQTLAYEPQLGHMTTFGGHPVSCAAAVAAFDVLSNEQVIETVKLNARLMAELLVHPKIKEVRNVGLLCAVELHNKELVTPLVYKAKELGLLIERFLFCPHSVRVSPPLTITSDQLKEGINLLLKALDLV